MQLARALSIPLVFSAFVGFAWSPDSAYAKPETEQALPVLALPPHAPQDAAETGSSTGRLFLKKDSAELRPLMPDRPDRGDSPTTVDAGHLQIETEVMAYAQQQGDQERVETFRWGGTEFRLGLTDQTDFEVLTESFVSTRTESGENSESVSGYGGTTFRFKHNIVGNDEGKFALGLVPFTRLSATSPIQEWGLGAPMSFDFNSDYSLGFSNEWGRREYNEGLKDRVSTSLSLSRSWPKRITSFLEYWQLWTPSGDLPLSSAIGIGGSLGMGRNTALDLGVHFGLNKDTEDLFPFSGFTQRF
jgi:hypothetical protein